MKKIPSIKSVMTPFPYSIDVDASLTSAVALLREHQIKHLPVTDKNRLVGVVSDRDIKLLLGPDYYLMPESELKVLDAYTPDPVVVDLNERLDSVALTMAERHIGSVLIVKQGSLVGIFTATDACRCLGDYLRQHFQPPGGGNEAA